MSRVRLVALLVFLLGSIQATPSHGARFEDNGDGTVTDNKTGLQWEKKLDGNECLGCPEDIDIASDFVLDPGCTHCVNQRYT